MNNAEYKFPLDLQKTQSQVTLQVNKGDTARTLLITLYNGGTLHRLGENSTVVLSAKKTNGRYLFNSCTIENDRTTIRYDFTSATTDTPGIVQCELLIADKEARTITSPRFTMIVDNLINCDDVFSADDNQFIIMAMSEEDKRIACEGERKSNELQREANETTRQDNEAERQRLESLRQEAEEQRKIAEVDRNKIADSLKEAEAKIANLEAAATGKHYDTVEESGVKYTTQFPDVLPYGILSHLGGLAMKWAGDTENSFSSGGTIHDGDIPSDDGELVVVSDASEVHLLAYSDLTDDNGDYYMETTHFVLPTNQRVRLSEATVYYVDERDGSTTDGVFNATEAMGIQHSDCDSPFKIIHGNIRYTSNSVKKVDIGMPYTLVGAKTYSGTPCTVKGNTVVMPKGSQTGILIPCALPKGTKVTVTANGENSAGEKVNKFIFRTSNSNASAEIQKGVEGTLTADSTYLLIYKYNASTALTEDLEISDIEIVISNPDSATLYTSHSVNIPDDLITYLNDNGYAYGVGLSETCYNYLDLTARTYHQYCKVENDVVVELANPITVDVSEYLAGDLDIVPLLPCCLARFTNEDRTSDAAPYTISYKKKIGG